MIFKITGHVYDINVQTATAFSSESYRLPYTILCFVVIIEIYDTKL